MSVSERAFIRDVNELSKHLKRPFHLAAEMMPYGFSDQDYIDTFITCFYGLWQIIGEFKKEHDIADKQRQRKGLAKLQYNFPPPKDFVLNKSKALKKNLRDKHKKGEILPDAERVELYKKYSAKAEELKEEKRQKQQKINEMQQTVNPKHANYFINTYFDVKHRHPEDVNTRMRILEEAAKFSCDETEVFFRKVNAAENNYNLRYFAFLTLQTVFGHTEVHFHANRKGKAKVGDDIKPKKMDTPELLMEEIYNSECDLENKKSFDIFLSHSSKDYGIVIKLKTILNSHNLSVYIDWVEDRQSLRRELSSADTAKAIVERIKQSKAFLYVLTKTSIKSIWTPWEIGYAHALGKKICVLTMEQVDNSPEYLSIYNKAILNDEHLYVSIDNNFKPVEDWV